MYTNIVAALTAIMATSVFAAPQAGGSSASGNSLTVGDASQQCGNDQALSCCNTNSGDNTDQGGLIGSLLNGVLGGSCTQVPVTVLGVQVPINQACGNNVAACCQGDQNGLVNVECTPISL